MGEGFAFFAFSLSLSVSVAFLFLENDYLATIITIPTSLGSWQLKLSLKVNFGCQVGNIGFSSKHSKILKAYTKESRNIWYNSSVV